MNNHIAIHLDQVSKIFEQSRNPLYHLNRLLRAKPPSDNTFTAVNRLSLQIAKGESLALIGQNGSGKSTTLQLIAGTLSPTYGKITTQGRIAALLELGSGFNPEFTGRENVFFNGQLLGLSRSTIEQRFDAIARFADIGNHLDQPVKTYSSGMFVRLAFAVVAHTDPDILIVDEALSVGDVFFQQKCFRKIRELQSAGVTLLFVSHDPGSVQKLCDRAVLLESGAIVVDSLPQMVLETYEAKILKRMDAERASRERRENIEPAIESFVQTDDVKILSVEVCDQAGRPIARSSNDQSVQLCIAAQFQLAHRDIHFGLRLKSSRGEVLFETNTASMGYQLGDAAVGEIVNITFQFPVHIQPDRYTLTIGVSSEYLGNGIFQNHLVLLNDQATLEITESSTPRNWQGRVDLAGYLRL
jgi:lipopolysaccharide transport system ATP-binding protein